MNKIQLLDCTLRDGGFVNSWEFGQYNAINIFQGLADANIEIIEIGFIDDRSKYNINKTMCPESRNFEQIYKDVKKNSSQVFAMIDYGTCDINNIEKRNKNSFIDGIRVIFKKKDINGALEYCKQIQKKGYKVSVNPVSITTYSDIEMLNLIEQINQLNPYAMSMVDTYGLVDSSDIIKYFYLIDKNLNKNIKLGYHSHNNFQLAFANSIALSKIFSNRDLILDTTLYGMGKSAGNCHTELMAMYLNNNFEKTYDINEILDIIDIYILKFYKEYCWGYQIPFFVSAMNDCHPNYVKYLLDKNMITIKEINKIVSKIENSKKLTFDKEYIESLYIDYQRKTIDDRKTIKYLKQRLSNSVILLVGPGVSISKKYKKINEYIKRNEAVVLSINHINSLVEPDYIFISNAKRFKQLETRFKSIDRDNIIITSNITDESEKAGHKINWGNIASERTIVGASALYLILNLLIELEIKKVVLAGFDGFRKYAKSYYDPQEEFYKSPDNVNILSKEIAKQLKLFSQKIEIEFLTESYYQKQGGFE